MTSQHEGLPESPKYPDFERIIGMCKRQMDEKFKQYGNSWTDGEISWSWWEKRLKGEVKEIFESFQSPEQTQKEIADAISILAMMFHRAQKDYWDEVVSSRLGI